MASGRGSKLVPSPEPIVYRKCNVVSGTCSLIRISFGASKFFGSMDGRPLNEPIVGMAATADDQGYWEVASHGGIFAFGDARFYGSMGGRPLVSPVVGMAATPDGKGLLARGPRWRHLLVW